MSGSEVRSVLSEVGPDVIVNAAAYTKVDLAETQPDEAFRANRDGPAVLAAASAAASIPLVHLSTDYVFDGSKSSPYVESDQVAPLGIYGRSKEAGEQAVRQRCREHVIIRTAWMYGRHGTNFLKTMLRLAAQRAAWGVVDDQLGNPTSTEDLAAAIMAAAMRAVAKDRCWGTYHFAGCGDATWYDFATEIVSAQAHITGRYPTVKRISTADYPTPAKRPANSRLDSTRFAEVFGVRAKPWRERVGPVVRAVLGEMAAR